MVGKGKCRGDGTGESCSSDGCGGGKNLTSGLWDVLYAYVTVLSTGSRVLYCFIRHN